jgi:3'-5' exonuclease
MFEALKYQTLLYLDTETTPIVKSYFDLTDEYKAAWLYHCKQNKLIDLNFAETGSFSEVTKILDTLWQKQASLVPEFSQIICTSIGEYIKDENNNITFKTWTRFLKNSNDNEKLLLLDVQKYLDSKNPKQIIAHNGKEFDYPFLIRRFITNNIMPPKQLQIFNKKPWEVELFDTKDIWKFGSTRSASLISICAALNIPPSKNDIDGSMVYGLFYCDERYENMKRIAKYCSNDVRALTLVVQRLTILDNPEIVMLEIKYV